MGNPRWTESSVSPWQRGPRTSDLVAQAQQFAQTGKEQFLRTFAYAPDDKLTWSPSPTAKSALRIAAHVGIFNQAFAAILRAGKLPGASMEEVAAAMNAAEQGVLSREQAVQVIEESVVAVCAALGALTPEAIDSVVETPVVTRPMPFFMNLPGAHMGNHAAQVDCLQTTWGDLELHT